MGDWVAGIKPSLNCWGVFMADLSGVNFNNLGATLLIFLLVCWRRAIDIKGRSHSIYKFNLYAAPPNPVLTRGRLGKARHRWIVACVLGRRIGHRGIGTFGISTALIHMAITRCNWQLEAGV